MAAPSLKVCVLKDSQYLETAPALSERSHSYGSHIHILKSAFAETLLAKFSTTQCSQAELFSVLRRLFSFLTESAAEIVLPRELQIVKTRMLSQHSEAEFQAHLIKRNTSAVVVDLMRAGILPSQICYETLLEVLNPEGVRQDHILLNRATNDRNEVVGVNIQGHKIAGRADDAVVFFPDPMGATGVSMKGVIQLYRKMTGAKKFVALHLIVTPEYLKTLSEFKSELQIFALRVDRGLSSEKVLRSSLGEFWSEEKGLNEKHYIVPGAGGVGEILNNANV